MEPENQEEKNLLTAEQMLERNIVPVKAEYLVRKAPAHKREQSQPAGAAEPAGAAPEAATEGAAPGTANDKGRDKEKEQTKSKSRKQMRKDVRAGRPPELCTNFALGRCTFGDGCRFSHDLAAYLRSKPADLPGACPWAALGVPCPYGVTCRYARKHTADDEQHRLLRETVPAPPEEPAAGEGAEPSAPASGGSPSGDADGGGSGGGLPSGPLPLPAPSSIEKETNFMSKETQTQLWKNRYDFSVADEILKNMGLRISFKHQPKPMPGGARRVCKSLGVDVTCGEMALATEPPAGGGGWGSGGWGGGAVGQGQASEWALLKRHPCEDLFGVQVCGGFPDALARCGQLISESVSVDFMDINMGCPIDLVCDKSAGSALLRQPRRIEQIVRATSAALGETPLTFKTRKGFNDGEDVAHTFLHKAGEWGAAAVTLHGRTRQQRYSKLADWEYVKSCAGACSAAGLQLLGNGDVFSFTDWNEHMGESGNGLASLMIGRGALIKPWIFTEIKEQRHWDISASERLDLYRSFCSAGLEHWGSDGRGVETTRRFLLEWLSFTCRYVPVGLLEVLPQRMNHRPPTFVGRSDLETLLGSDDPQDWIRISEMLLGPPPAPLSFAPKHKSSAYGPPGAASELDMARG
ncbi:hypothetical protein GPECTOR_31g355 [Gonium pectorale]|uniref:tRNA-dihydrouridine(47) synthase [NAD(P)(+)] n=1 Tax=Gonium pectorale TaxID=33097 RepID=A0A150GDS7_GONPE|nr:hypothetical protein GPECTOR_31g355 [Gonium pectorale]|eukprot:KXZ47992.1 hypothetical protein GPECTOR_31g355 [Gonium pectorale]